MPFVKKSRVQIFDSGKVYYSEAKSSKTFNRKLVFEYIRDTYGDSLADQVDTDYIKAGEPRQSILLVLTGPKLNEE